MTQFLGIASKNRTCEDAGVRRLSHSWIVVLLCLSSLAQLSLACVVVYPAVAVGPNFRVKVADRGRPVQGLQVGLYVGASAKISAASDKNGIAVFRNVPPGSYQLRADHDAGFPDGYYMEVKLGQSSETTVPLRWPSVTPAVAGSLKGVLHMPGGIPGQAQPSISLELLEGISGRRVTSGNTDRNGAFDFPSVGPGLYFLSLKPVGGVMAMAVESNASSARFDIDLGETDCGLQYTNHSECSLTNLHLPRLSGRVVDETGASISRAEILLLDPDGKTVQQARSDSVGSFASIRPPDGTYQLVVREAGFTPLRGTLTVDANGSSGSLEIQLGILGRCSKTNMQ